MAAERTVLTRSIRTGRVRRPAGLGVPAAGRTTRRPVPDPDHRHGADARHDTLRILPLVHRLWPNDAIPAEPAQLLPLPRYFAQLSDLVTEDMIDAPLGPSPDAHVQGIRAYVDAGFDEVYVSQVGGGHAGFFDVYASQVLPRLRES
jgi:hypothetical protein